MSDSFLLGDDGVYRCQAFQQFVWQRHGFGTRSATPPARITLRQVHSDLVWNAHALADRDREGDALVTDDPGRSIGIRTADCVPILLLDSKRRAVGAVHAGWRGTLAGIVNRAIQKMSADFGSYPADIYAAIGPCIRACCYQVGEDIASQFAPLFPEWEPLIGKRYLDLPAANRRHLQSAGVSSERIFDCGLCTFDLAEYFFSYRREPAHPGRMLSSVCRLA